MDIIRTKWERPFLIHRKYEQDAPSAVEHVLWQVQLNLDLEVAQSN